MSSAVSVFTKKKPVLEHMAGFLGTIPHVTVKSIVDGVAIYVREESAGQAAIFCEGPFAVEQLDVPDSIAGDRGDFKWQVDIVVSSPEITARQAAAKISRFMADSWDGYVYSPECESLSEGIQQDCRRVAGKTQTRISILELVWLFPRSHSARFVAEALIHECSHVCPRSLPKRYGWFEPLQHHFDPLNVGKFLGEAERIGRDDVPEDTLFWDAVTPRCGGVLSWAMNLRCKHEGIPCSSLELHFGETRHILMTDWADIVHTILLRIARRIHPFFACAYVRRNVIAKRKLWFDTRTEAAAIGMRNVWLGLPDIPMWLTWYGEPYVKYVRDTLAQVVTQESGEGIFVSYGDRPLHADELEGMVPELPRELVIGRVCPPSGLSTPLEAMARGFEVTYGRDGFVAHPMPVRAEFIPEIEGHVPDM